MKKGRFRRFFFVGALVVVGPMFSLLALEVGARIIERGRRHPPGSSLTAPLLRPNPNGTGSFRNIPDLRLTAIVKGRTIDFSTNGFGMRWRDVALRKANGVKRIAVLGDSFVYGCWAGSPARTFVGVLDRELGEPYEALNFGVSGYGFDDMELMLLEETLRFAPDYVLVASYNGNDFRDTWLGLDKFVIRNGAADLDPRILDRIPACCRSREYPTPQQAFDDSIVRRHASLFASGRLLMRLFGLQNRRMRFQALPGFTTETFWSRQPWPPVAFEAKDLALETLERMRAIAVAGGARFGVVCIPFKDQVYARHQSGRNWDIAYPQIYVKIWARERQVPVLDLLPLLREHVAENNDDLYLGGDTHFEDHGHDVVGRLMTRWFLREMR
ncbi:MAG: SGNH/GDSL hydrolase family protein [Vicinamibacteria bacterium]|nr:SGNH/GDSL hydrolase family protein [Vicinamibacteria bacterium]